MNVWTQVSRMHLYVIDQKGWADWAGKWDWFSHSLSARNQSPSWRNRLEQKPYHSQHAELWLEQDECGHRHMAATASDHPKLGCNMGHPGRNWSISHSDCCSSRRWHFPFPVADGSEWEATLRLVGAAWVLASICAICYPFGRSPRGPSGSWINNGWLLIYLIEGNSRTVTDYILLVLGHLWSTIIKMEPSLLVLLQ